MFSKGTAGKNGKRGLVRRCSQVEIPKWRRLLERPAYLHSEELLYAWEMAREDFLLDCEKIFGDISDM